MARRLNREFVVLETQDMHQTGRGERRPGLKVAVNRNCHDSIRADKQMVARFLSKHSPLTARKVKGYVSRARKRSRTQHVGRKWKDVKHPCHSAAQQVDRTRKQCSSRRYTRGESFFETENDRDNTRR